MSASGRVSRRLLGRRALVLAACGGCIAGALLFAGPLDAAGTFGPVPKPIESRCAPVRISAHLVSIGAKIEATAGPGTSNCGGPSTKVHWAWPNDDPEANQIPGLVETGPCPGTSAHCTFRARLYTQAGLWQGICISGVSPQGAFTSCDSYAVKIGDYHYLTGTIFNLSGPVKVNLSGPGGRQSTMSEAGEWTFAVKNGTYTVSFTAHHRKFRQAVKVHAKPGTSVTLNITA